MDSVARENQENRGNRSQADMEDNQALKEIRGHGTDGTVQPIFSVIRKYQIAMINQAGSSIRHIPPRFLLHPNSLSVSNDEQQISKHKVVRGIS